MRSLAQHVATIVATKAAVRSGLGPGNLAGRARFADMTASGSATVAVQLSGGATFADVTASGSAAVAVQLSGGATFADVTASGSAEVTDPPGETVRITVPAASWDVSVSAFRSGASGSNYFGAFVAIPSVDLGDHAWYFTHDGLGWDPQPHNASLTGYTMHAIDLSAGAVTAANVATALRSAMSSVYSTVGGTGANVDVTDAIDSAGAFTGSSSPGAAGAWGCREDSVFFDANPISSAMLAHADFTAGPALVTGLAARLNTAGDQVRLAVYEGGGPGSEAASPNRVQTADLAGTDLLCETVITGSGTGWVCQPLAPAQVHELADNTDTQLLIKGETSSTHASFVSTGAPGTGDLTVQQLALLDTGDVDPDPTVAYPSTLEGTTIGSSFSVMLMIAFEYRTAPQRGDAGGITVTAL